MQRGKGDGITPPVPGPAAPVHCKQRWHMGRSCRPRRRFAQLWHRADGGWMWCQLTTRAGFEHSSPSGVTRGSRGASRGAVEVPVAARG